MPNSIRVDSEFKTNRRDMNGTLNRALENRRSYLGFTLGMAATVVVVLGALAWTFKQTGFLQF